MLRYLILLSLCFTSFSEAATIAIIDTGFDLDHDYLRPRILRNETDEEIDFQGWDFFDNSHLKKPVIDDKSSLHEILLYRSLKAKGHKQGLSMEEFEWFNKKSSDKEFMEKVRMFKKHSHGTFVAGIALREGENISIFPIRGLNIPTPVVAVGDNSSEGQGPLKGKTQEDKFIEEMNQSIDRISRKFSKICNFVARKRIEVINASYGITYKNIITKFRERYKEMTGKDLEETKLKLFVDDYFRKLYERGEKTMKRHPKILFVFSAGNSGIDNDLYHHYPSKIKVPNAIAVAAMNGEYLATFSNFGMKHVDIGAPGVAIPSILPKVYQEGTEIYSPASGTSMAAPYVANLAAQIMNSNSQLTPPEVRRIILETGDEKEHLKTRLTSGAIVSNQKALRAALLSRDLPLDQAISLGSSGLLPMEDKISIGLPPAVAVEEMKKKVMDSIPSVITPSEVEEEPTVELTPTRSESFSPKDQLKEQPDKSEQLPSVPQVESPKATLEVPSNQTSEQSLTLSAETPASASQPQSKPLESQSQENVPSSP